MSRIYFHTQDEDAEIHGSERHYFASLCAEMTYAVLRRHTEDSEEAPALLRRAFHHDHYMLSVRGGVFADRFRTHLIVSDAPLLLGDQEVSIFSLVLNTALRLGSDPVRLAARLHGQCEIHAYVEGANRAWLADIIEQGRQFELYRSGQGWEDVVALLRRDATSPVVTSYSVCEQFPNAGIANWSPPLDEDGEKDWDAWYGLSDQTRWEMALAGLRARRGGLELKPDDWSNFSFGHNLDAHQYIKALYAIIDAEISH